MEIDKNTKLSEHGKKIKNRKGWLYTYYIYKKNGKIKV